MGQCCTSEQGKGGADDYAAGNRPKPQRALENATRMDRGGEGFSSFSTDVSRERADTYAELDARYERNSSSFLKSRSLSIQIPQDNENRNPDFKTPQEYHLQQKAREEQRQQQLQNPGGQAVAAVEEAFEQSSDGESEMMQMVPSDSVSSMGSNMIRVDSSAVLSQASSFQDLNAVGGKDLPQAKMRAVGSATQFVAVAEEPSSDDESMVHRVEGSDDESVMQRVDDGLSAQESVMRIGGDGLSEAPSLMRVGGDAASSQKSIMRVGGLGGDAENSQKSLMIVGGDLGGLSEQSSVMQVGGNALQSSSLASFHGNPASMEVPKELRNLDRMQGSVADLGKANLQANSGLGVSSQFRRIQSGAQL